MSSWNGDYDEPRNNPRQALEEAFRTVFPPPPNAHLGIDVPALEAHTQIVRRFRRFLDAEAWTDAAMMLVPEGWRIGNLSQHDHPLLRERGEWLCTLYPEGQLGKLRADLGKARCNHADHPALALAQACLKARENGDG